MKESVVIVCLVIGCFVFFLKRQGNEIAEKETELLSLEQKIYQIEELYPDLVNATAETKAELRSALTEKESAESYQVALQKVTDILINVDESAQTNPAQLLLLLPDFLKEIQHLSVEQIMQMSKELSEVEAGGGEARSFFSMIMISIAGEMEPLFVLGEELSPESRETQLAAFHALLKSDVETAKAWLERQGVDEDTQLKWQKGQMQAAVLATLFESDPNGAIAYLEKLGDRHYISVGESLIPSLSAEQRESLLQSVKSMKEGDMKLVLTWGLGLAAYDVKDLSGVKSLVSELYPEGASHENIIRVGDQLARRIDSAEGADNLLEYTKEVSPDSEGQTIASIVSHWMTRDFNSAGEWLMTQEPSKERDQGIATFSASIARTDGQSAMEWAAAMQDEKESLNVQKRQFSQWLSREPDEAKSWAAENEVPEEWLKP